MRRRREENTVYVYLSQMFGAGAISFIAGGLICLASVPRMLIILQGKELGRDSILRNVMITIGNLLWVDFGLSQNVSAIVLFCSTTATLQFLIALSMIRERRLRKPVLSA